MYVGATVAERLDLSGFNPRLGHFGFSHVEIVPNDAVGRRVFSGISRFPPRCSILTSITLIGCKDLDAKSRPNLYTPLHSMTLTIPVARLYLALHAKSKKQIILPQLWLFVRSEWSLVGVVPTRSPSSSRQPNKLAISFFGSQRGIC
ncbi:hypothetical protein PR048_019196 [Dryococelus australis]|uniref:Uncharacterized protein n=1 Tax=Dryococelus australis TaxID=614101 RepID=A0ABQ9H2V6_9NEOP|nr:hypothetical protein PR048_019196 [Dryococelus australis]